MKKLSKFQGGYSALMLMAGLAVVAITQVGAAKYSVNTAQRTEGITAGATVGEINRAVSTYVFNYGANILGNTAIALPAGGNVTNSRSPSVADLQALVGLNGNTPATAKNGGSYVVAIQNGPAGCLGLTCNLQFQTYVDRAFTDDSGGYYGRMLEAAIASNPGDVGVSQPDAPALVRGPNWTFANPLGATSGVLMAVGGTGASVYAQFVRVNDTRDPDLKGKLSVVGDVATNGSMSAVGDISTAGGRAKLRSDGWVQGNSGLYSPTGSAYLGGDVSAGGGSATLGTDGFVSGSSGFYSKSGVVYVGAGVYTGGEVSGAGGFAKLQSDGNILARGGKVILAPGGAATSGVSCGDPGQISTDSTGGMLNCTGGLWSAVSGAPAGTLCGSINRNWYNQWLDFGAGTCQGKALISYNSVSQWVPGSPGGESCDREGSNCVTYPPTPGYWTTSNTPFSNCPAGYSFKMTGHTNYGGVSGDDLFSCMKV